MSFRDSYTLTICCRWNKYYLLLNAYSGVAHQCTLYKVYCSLVRLTGVGISWRFCSVTRFTKLSSQTPTERSGDEYFYKVLEINTILLY